MKNGAAGRKTNCGQESGKEPRVAMGEVYEHSTQQPANVHLRDIPSHCHRQGRSINAKNPRAHRDFTCFHTAKRSRWCRVAWGLEADVLETNILR